MIQIQVDTNSSHQNGVAIIAFFLCLMYNRTQDVPVRTEHIGIAAQFHDSSEKRDGDLPSGTKKRSSSLAKAYKELEVTYWNDLYSQIPSDLAAQLREYRSLTQRETQILKLADILHVHFFAMREVYLGNRSFEKRVHEIQGSLETHELSWLAKKFFNEFKT